MRASAGSLEFSVMSAISLISELYVAIHVIKPCRRDFPDE